jgi:hypothetical protein
VGGRPFDQAVQHPRVGRPDPHGAGLPALGRCHHGPGLVPVELLLDWDLTGVQIDVLDPEVEALGEAQPARERQQHQQEPVAGQDLLGDRREPVDRGRGGAVLRADLLLVRGLRRLLGQAGHDLDAPVVGDPERVAVAEVVPVLGVGEQRAQGARHRAHRLLRGAVGQHLLEDPGPAADVEVAAADVRDRLGHVAVPVRAVLVGGALQRIVMARQLLAGIQSEL